MPSVAAAYKQADAVFVGTIASVDGKTTEYTITVEGVWKGDVPASVVVRAGHGRGNCSFGALGKTKKWLFVVSGSKPPYPLHICSGTRRATPATLAQLEKLHGKPKPPG